VQLVLSAAPATDFPALIVDWAADNPGGETFFDPNGAQNMVLSADVTEDTDEFDQHVIAHEFGHYIEFNFSRADNIGGPHGIGDKLDIRVAFGEGFGYAFAGMVLNNPAARDTYTYNGNQQFLGCTPLMNGRSFCTSEFNLEANPSTNTPGSPIGNFGCWCSESSVWAILWDIFDSGAEPLDAVALGFQPIWNILINEQANTRAYTSIFSFIDAFKRANGGSAAAIDTLVAAQNISTITDAYGSGETHFPNPPFANMGPVLPVYTSIAVPSGAVTLSSVDDAGHYNKLGNRRFLRFTLAAARPTLTISLTSSNPDVDADPDFIVSRNGNIVNFADGQDPPPQPETMVINNAAAGDYLIDVYDCANGCSQDEGTPGDYNLTVTVN
jgi:hypothetical protein